MERIEAATRLKALKNPDGGRDLSDGQIEYYLDGLKPEQYVLFVEQQEISNREWLDMDLPLIATFS